MNVQKRAPVYQRLLRVHGLRPSMPKTDKTLAEPALRFEELSLSALKSNPWQPRSETDQDRLKELVESIKTTGVLNPIVVRQKPDRTTHYEIAFGARRVAASRLAGNKVIPALVRDLTDRQMKVYGLAENLFREDLGDSDKEMSIFKLWSSEFKDDDETKAGRRKDATFTGTQDMSRETGIPRQTIERYLQAHTARQELARSEHAKHQREAIESLSSRDVQELAPIVRESPEVAVIIAQARVSEDEDEAPALRSRDVRQIVQAVRAAPESQREDIARQIIEERQAMAQTMETVQEQIAEAVPQIKAEPREEKDDEPPVRQEEITATQRLAAIEQVRIDVACFCNLTYATDDTVLRSPEVARAILRALKQILETTQKTYDSLRGRIGDG